jgi:hypothetical protein
VPSFVPNKDVIAVISKKLGKMILARKHHNFDLADNICIKLCNEYVVEIVNGSREWMAVVPRSGRWLNNNNNGRDESNIVSREEWKEEEEEDGNASCSIDFVNGGGTNKDKAENNMVIMKDKDSNGGGALSVR